MSRKGYTKGLLGDDGDPLGMPAAIRGFLEHQTMRNYSPAGMHSTESGLRVFSNWAYERSLTRPSQITKAIVESYQRWVFHYRKANGKPLTFTAQYQMLQKVRCLFKWLARTDAIPTNPASDLQLPRLEKRLPRAVLTEREVEKVMAVAEAHTVIGLRDRAIMEVLYSTGMRRHEVLGLGIYDVDHEGGTVRIRLGKGKKDRTVPIGARALSWLQRYMEDARPRLMMPPDEQVLFLSEHGAPMKLDSLTNRIRDYVNAARIGKRGSCHMFRHTMATLMLEGGADVRYIQEILGHVELSTTAIYTRVSIRHLKAVHAATHPGAHLAALGGAERAEVSLEKADPEGESRDVAALFSSLAAEEEGDGQSEARAEEAPSRAAPMWRMRKERAARG